MRNSGDLLVVLEVLELVKRDEPVMRDFCYALIDVGCAKRAVDPLGVRG